MALLLPRWPLGPLTPGVRAGDDARPRAAARPVTGAAVQQAETDRGAAGGRAAADCLELVTICPGSVKFIVIIYNISDL